MLGVWCVIQDSERLLQRYTAMNIKMHKIRQIPADIVDADVADIKALKEWQMRQIMQALHKIAGALVSDTVAATKVQTFKWRKGSGYDLQGFICHLTSL